MNVFELYDKFNNRVGPVVEIEGMKNDPKHIKPSEISFAEMLSKAQKENQEKEEPKKDSSFSERLDNDTTKQSLIASYVLLNSLVSSKKGGKSDGRR